MSTVLAACLENDLVRLFLAVEGNRWTLEDKRSGVSWGNREGDPWIGLYKSAGGTYVTSLMLDAISCEERALRCRFLDHEGGKAPLALVMRLIGDALHVYVVPDEGASLPAIELLGHGLEASAQESGEALLPVRMGLLLPAEGQSLFEQKFGTYDYEGAHLAMTGLLKRGAVLMVTWGDPYVTLYVSREKPQGVANLRLRFVMPKTARSLQLRCLGRGDLTTLARAYRERASQLGYRVPWDEKLRQRPQAARLFGASNFKLWTALARRIDENLVEQSVTVRWTFDEVARIAEHLKYDLKIDDLLFHLGGWTRYGYDCRHPDIMPANPECGGNEGLIDCARRVQACGYLFCLHDNYQDMYRDAPSWDEVHLQKDADGAPHLGGVWLGGQAYYTCARQALRLAQRPQNLPLVRELVCPDIYFIDTTYAVGPQECYDPRHPLTKSDDIHWKIALSDYARDLFGMFGSECGREWAVPHADFFEGLASVSGHYYHRLDPEKLGARVVPFFDMIFHDCIAIHGKYGYKPEEMAEQVIHHVAMGRTLYYHALGDHLYWESAERAELPFPERGTDAAVYTRAHNGWAEGLCVWDRFIKNTHEILSPLYRRTARALIERYDFLDDDRRVRHTVFDNGAATVVNGSDRDWEVHSDVWGEVLLPPYGFWAEAPDFIAFHAKSFQGHTYDKAVLFTLTSQDGRPLASSAQVRVFHGFGDATLTWRGRPVSVRREAVI